MRLFYTFYRLHTKYGEGASRIHALDAPSPLMHPQMHPMDTASSSLMHPLDGCTPWMDAPPWMYPKMNAPRRMDAPPGWKYSPGWMHP